MLSCMETFSSILQTQLPGTIPQHRFVQRGVQLTAPLGFSKANTITCVGICRDELCRPLGWAVRDAWGEAFNFSSLAGMLFLGKTGFSAAHEHGPIEGGKRHFAYFALPHVAIGLGGELGHCRREGQQFTSTACGALEALRIDLQSGRYETYLQPDDIEQSLLRARLASRLIGSQIHGAGLDLLGLTKLAYAAIIEDLRRMIAQTVDPTQADYAVFSGIQIHGPDGTDYVCPRECFAVVNGKTHPLDFSPG